VALFSKFFGKTISEAAAFALGGAMRSPLEPPLVELTNETWGRFVDSGITVPTEPGDAAEIAAERVADRQWAKDQAKQRGYGGEQMDKLIDAVQNAPGTGELFQLWRRGLIDKAAFDHGLRKARLEDQWDTPLEGLHDVLLSSEELAMMQQQGFVDQGRADAEGGLQGVTPERQQLRFEASGLPPGIVEGLQMLRRGIIDEATFATIVREGHTKTKYTGVLTQLRDVVLNANDYVTNAIRGGRIGRDGSRRRAHRTYARTNGLAIPEPRPAAFLASGLYRPAPRRHLSGRHWRHRPRVFEGLARVGYSAGVVQPRLGAKVHVSGGVRAAGARSGRRPDRSRRRTNPALRGLGADPRQDGYGEVGAGLERRSEGGHRVRRADLYDSGHITQAEAHTELVALGYDAAEATKKIEVLDARRVSSAKTAAIGDMHGDFKKGRLDAPAVEKGLAALGLEPWAVAAIVEAWRAYRIAEAAQPPPTVPPPVA
jgi:hypothetical protein